MNWISQFWLPFLFPIGIIMLFYLGELTDSHGDIGIKDFGKALVLGIALGLLMSGGVMIVSLVRQPFVFERWFTAICFGGISIRIIIPFLRDLFEKDRKGSREYDKKFSSNMTGG